MLMTMAFLVLLAALASSAERERREARLRAGAPIWADLARITGLADHRELSRLPGVSLTCDGQPRFDPARRGALPAHLTALLVDHPWGHGLSLALAVAAIGIALEAQELPVLGRLLLAMAACYQLLAWLYALSVWVEARTSD